ncbi:MAG TPA: universal stress protein [Thermoanaerobaculia bacterium]
MSEPIYKHIVTPVDLGGTSIAALHYAGLLAKKLGAEVTIVYADELATLYGGFDSEWLDTRVSPADETVRLEKALREFAAQHLQNVAAPDIVVKPGHPVATIVRVAKERGADLIIMGTHGRRGWRRALAGSVADGVVRNAAQPVLVVPEHHDGQPLPEQISRVVCPVNFSDAARVAACHASALTTAFGADLILVHVSESADPDSAEILEQFREWLPEEVREHSSYRQVVLRGGPAERVLDCVEDLQADLLVIGAQLKWLRSESVIGTTSERLLRFSPVPILTVTRPLVPESSRKDRQTFESSAS